MYEDMLNEAYENVPSDKSHQKRFEIPKADLTEQGKKTIVHNFRKIAKKFGRNPKHLLKFLSMELATNGELIGEKVIFKGNFSELKINSKIDEYAEKFVICPKCDSPDTKIIDHNGRKYLKCEACGAQNPVEEV